MSSYCIYFICVLIKYQILFLFSLKVYPAPQPLLEVHEQLEFFKVLIEDLKSRVPDLERIIPDGQELIKNNVRADIEAIISVAEEIVSSTGECGQAAVPEIDKAKNDTEAALKQCLQGAVDEGNAVKPSSILGSDKIQIKPFRKSSVPHIGF